MGRIHLLEDVLSNQIAAGEVVERPASVVKELVENAVDAGATQITIEIAEGGVNKIRIVDNGHGMGRDDLVMCLKRHATSKLKAISDLDTLSTLGFRGEAIPSIASVSRLSIRTRETGAVGAIRLKATGGAEVDIQDAGGPVGTEFLVEDLFFNVPARRKFLKTPATEASHIQEIAQRVALCYPSVAVRYIKDGRQVFDYPSCADLRERIASVFGSKIAARLTQVSVPGAFGLDGYVGAAEDAKSTPRHYHVFINGRFVRDRVVMSAVQSAYGSSLPRGKHPLVVLRLTLPALAVDVNVHPAKTEVRFSDSRGVHRLVARAIDGALRAATEDAPTTGGTEPAISGPESYALPSRSGEGVALDRHRDRIFQAMERMATKRAGHPAKRPGRGRDEDQLSFGGGRPAATAPPARSPQRDWSASSQSRVQPLTPQSPISEPRPQLAMGTPASTVPEGAPISLAEIDSQTRVTPALAKGLKALVNIGAYTLFAGEGGLVAYSRERVLMLAHKQRLSSGAEAIELTPPATLDLRPNERAALGSLGGTFEAAGIEVEPFGGNTFLIKRGPSGITAPDLTQLVREALKSPDEAWSVSKIRAALAERTGRRLSGTLTMEEMKSVLLSIEGTEANMEGLGFALTPSQLSALDK